RAVPPPRRHAGPRAQASRRALDQARGIDLAGARNSRGPRAESIGARRRERALTSPTHRARTHRAAPAPHPRRPAVGGLPREPRSGMAPGTADRATRDAAPLAPGGLPAVL